MSYLLLQFVDAEDTRSHEWTGSKIQVNGEDAEILGAHGRSPEGPVWLLRKMHRSSASRIP